MTRISRRSEVDPFIVMDVMAAAAREEAAGRTVIHMEVGQPGSPAPAAARAALAAAMERDALGYTVALGLPELRARIARHYAEVNGIEVDPGRVVVTEGASGGIILAMLALFDVGETVALGDPSYPAYRNTLSALGLRVRRIETGPETNFQPRPEDLGDADGLLVASPANPTGTMLDRPGMAALAAACRDRGAAFVSDEIYHGLTYGTRAVSALEVDQDAIVINSFSKYWSMTGWRVGWMVVPEALVRPVERLAQNLFVCAPHASQVAALAAMDASAECEANLAVYAANRDLLLEALPRAGFAAPAPGEGAFYIWADVSRFGLDSRELCARLLSEAGVALTPGWDFDPVRGGDWVRVSFARTQEEIAEGARRLLDWAVRQGQAPDSK